MKQLKILAAKIAIAFLALIGGVISPAYAGIPVIDGTNLGQNIMTATEEIAQTIKQIEQYTTQLNQYSTQIQQLENQLQNTLQPATNIWDQASTTVSDLLGTINTLTNLQNQYGNLTNYLDTYQDIRSYKDNACFSAKGCTAAQWATLLNSRNLSSTAQQIANNASILGLSQQQEALQNDANTLVNLQASAQGATGQLQALGYANQLTSAQSNQLLQIRGLLIAQQNAITTRNQAIADQEAQQAAAAAQFRVGTYKTSTANSNWHY